MVDGLSNRDAEIAGKSIQAALVKLVPLNNDLGQSEEQKEKMLEHIEERAKYWVETNTLRKIREIFEEEEFPTKLETAMREWADNNIMGRISDGLDEMMCDRTRSTISEYDLVRYTDDAYQEAVQGSSDIDSSIENWMDCNSSNYLPDNDELGRQIKEEIMDEIKEEAVDEDKVTSIITDFLKKSLHKVLGFAYFKDAVNLSEVIAEKDLMSENKGYELGELTRMKLRDARYGEILDALGQEDTDETWAVIIQKAKENA